MACLCYVTVLGNEVYDFRNGVYLPKSVIVNLSLGELY